MNTTQLMYIVMAVGILTLIVVKQLTWRAVTPTRAFKLPLFLAIGGIIMLVAMPVALTPADIAMAALEAVLGAAIGLLMGRITTIRRSTGAQKSEFEFRLGAAGLLLWVLMIAVRFGLGYWAHGMGLAMAASPGIIYLVVAANRAANGWVVLARTRSLASAPQTV